jgi:hypothetical protein
LPTIDLLRLKSLVCEDHHFCDMLRNINTFVTALSVFELSTRPFSLMQILAEPTRSLTEED